MIDKNDVKDLKKQILRNSPEYGVEDYTGNLRRECSCTCKKKGIPIIPSNKDKR